MTTEYQHYDHPSAWSAEDLGSKEDLGETLEQAHLLAFEKALRHVQAKGGYGSVRPEQASRTHMKAKILIIGGGIMGTSIAIEAARRSDPLRAPVVLVEKGEIGSGSSGRSGAILRQHYGDRVTAAMARESLRVFASFESRTGRSIGFRRTGVLTLAGPDQPDWVQRIQENVEMLRELGIRTQIVEERRIRELLPGIALKKGTVGAWEPEGGFVHPQKTLEAFAALARSYGAVTRRGVSVNEIHVEGGRVTGVTTDEGHVATEKVVIVAGPWSAKLLASVGVNVPLRTIRPENLFFPLGGYDPEEEGETDDLDTNLEFDIEDDPIEHSEEQESVVLPGLHPTLIDLEHALYCRAEPSARSLRVGRTEYHADEVLEDPDDLDETVSEESRAWGRKALAARLPEYEDSQETDALAGWYTLTPDAQGIIGEVPQVQGLYVATGFSGHGFKLGPSVGEGMAQMLFDEPVTAFEPEFFSLERFTGKEEWTGRFGL